MPNDHYNLLTTPQDLALDIDFIKKNVEIDFSDDTEDLYLSQLARSAIAFFEKDTGIILLTSDVELLTNQFPACCPIVIRRKPNVVITSVEHLVEGSFVTVSDTVYYTTQSDAWSTLQPFEDEEWPDNTDKQLQAVKVTFTVGYGTNFSDIPEDIRLGLVQHITAFLENRGDCPLTDIVPKSTKLIYSRYRDLNLDLC